MIDTFLPTAAYLGRASLASGGVAGPLHALTLAGALKGRGEVAPGDEGAEVGVVGEDVVGHQLVEEQDQVGHLCPRLLGGVGGPVVGRLCVEELEEEGLEDGWPRDEVALLLLLALATIRADQVGLALLQQLGGHKGAVLAAALAADGPLAQDEHHRLVLSADTLASLHLAPQTTVQLVQAVGGV